MKVTHSKAEIGGSNLRNRVQPFKDLQSVIAYIESASTNQQKFEISLAENLVVDMKLMTVVSDTAKGNRFKCVKTEVRDGFKKFCYERI